MKVSVRLHITILGGGERGRGSIGGQEVGTFV